ncbi:MAG: DMT family transporter [Thermoplasmata archaeon]
MSKNLYYSIFLLLVTFFWGVTFPLIKVSLQYISPLPFLALRFSVSTIIILPFIIRNRQFRDRKAMIYGFWAGFYLMLGYVFQTIGLLYTSAGASGLITGLYVVILPLISIVYLKTRVSRIIIISSIIAFTGLIIMSTGAFSGALGWFGDILTMICAFAYAANLAYLSKRAAEFDSYVFSFYQLLMVAVFSALAIPFIPGEQFLLNAYVIFTILFTAIFAGVLAIFVTTKAMIYVEPSVAGIIFVGEPIFAALTSVWLINEHLSLYTIIGGTIMMVAIFIVTISKYVENRSAALVSRLPET